MNRIIHSLKKKEENKKWTKYGDQAIVPSSKIALKVQLEVLQIGAKPGVSRNFIIINSTSELFWHPIVFNNLLMHEMQVKTRCT